MIGYICLSNNNNYFKKKLRLNSIKITNNNNNIKIDICIEGLYGIKDDEKLLRKQIGFGNKLLRKLVKNNVTKVVIEEKIYQKYENILKEIYSSDIEVVTGNNLYENMLNNIISYILDNNNKINMQEFNLGIAINLLTYTRLSFIRSISNNIKGLTILTENVEKFDNLHKEILSENGLSIKVTDNYKNGFKNCNMIINFDINNDKLINNNFNNCIIINFSDRITKIRRTFKGIIINDIVIKIDKQNIINNQIDLLKFKNTAIIESLNINIKDLLIENLIGIKEIISLQDIEKFEFYKKKK